MKTSLQILSFFAITFFIGCGSSDEDPDKPTLTTIDIVTSGSLRLDAVGSESTSLSVVGKDQNGKSIDITSTITWSSNSQKASVDQNGVVTAQAAGSATITAMVDGLSSTIDVTIWDSSVRRIEIYVSDVGVNRNGPHLILKYDEFGENPETFISSGLNRPQDIVFLEDEETVLVSNLGGNNILKYNLNTGASKGTFASGIAGPTRMDIGPDDLLYVIQWNGGPVQRYELDGTFVDDFTSESINEAIGMAWDDDGNLYVSSFNNGTGGFVLKFDTNGDQVETFIDSNLNGPTDIWFDSNGDLFVNDWSSSNVRRFNSEGVYQGVQITGVNQPEGVDFMDNGDILLGASGTGSIKRYSQDGTFITDLVPSGRGGLTTPNAVVLRRVNYFE